MKNTQVHFCLVIGLLVYSLIAIVSRLATLPDFLTGFFEGFGCSLIILGALISLVNMTPLKNAKRKLLGKNPE